MSKNLSINEDWNHQGKSAGDLVLSCGPLSPYHVCQRERPLYSMCLCSSKFIYMSRCVFATAYTGRPPPKWSYSLSGANSWFKAKVGQIFYGHPGICQRYSFDPNPSSMLMNIDIHEDVCPNGGDHLMRTGRQFRDNFMSSSWLHILL